MKKSVKIAGILLSLAVFSVLYYRLSVIRTRSLEANVVGVLMVLIALMLLVFAYKELIRRFSRGKAAKEDYAFLFPLERETITGEVEFYFTLDNPRKVAISILDSAMKELTVIIEKDFAKGGHIVRYNSDNLNNGIYFYCLRSDNQKTMKRMIVKHDKLSA